MKIVVNKCFGGFGLSHEAVVHYLKLKGLLCFFYRQTKYTHRDGKELYEKVSLKELNDFHGVVFTFTKDLGPSFTKFPEGDDSGYFYDRNISRTDPLLVETVEKMGKKASGWCGNLQIVEIPDGVDWEIDDYDGMESIHEKHRSW